MTYAMQRGRLHWPRLPIKTCNYPGPGECNAIQWIIPIIVLMLSLATWLLIDILSRHPCCGCWPWLFLSVCLSVCQSVCCCCCCCMLANKIIDKTNHLRGKSLRPQPIVLGSTASWLTDTQHVRNNLTTKQRGEKTIQNREKNQTQKSQQNVPKTYSLYICI